MPRGMPRRAIDRIRKWDAKVTPDFWAFTITATKELAMEKVIQYHVDYEMIYQNVKRVLERFPSEAFRTQEYMWYALKLYHCLRVYTGRALTKCANASTIYFAVMGLNVEALYGVAHALGVKPDPLPDIVAGLGLRVGAPEFMVVNLVDGPSPVASTVDQVAAEIMVENLAYIEGVYVEAVNPQGSGVTLFFRVEVVHSGGYTQLSSEQGVGEGQVFSDWLRWILDALPDGVTMKGVRVVARVSQPPSPGSEPYITMRLVGVRAGQP